MKRIIRALKTLNYRLLSAILMMMLLPTAYQTVRIFFFGDMPDAQGFNIASQLAWVNLFYEVIQEALILPLFFLLGRAIANKEELENKVRTGLLMTAAVYSVIAAVIIIFARPLVVLMAQDDVLIEETVSYIRLETVAALFSTLWKFMLLVLGLLRKDKLMYIVLAAQFLLSVTLDVFLISKLPISLDVGINGIAVTDIIVNAVIALIAGLLLISEKIHIFKRQKLSFSWLKEWWKIGKYSGLEALLRNLVFMTLIIHLVNVVAEQGTYWAANNFIWQWLLLPGIALSDLIKKEIAENNDCIKEKTFGYIILTAIFAAVWLISIPFWPSFLANVMMIPEHGEVFIVVMIQTVFYITFLFNKCIFDSTFYGLGKTSYMLVQSVCIDLVYYVVIFILYITGVFEPTLFGISLMFGVGMALDFIPSAVLYVRLLKKRNIKIDFKREELPQTEN